MTTINAIAVEITRAIDRNHGVQPKFWAIEEADVRPLAVSFHKSKIGNFLPGRSPSPDAIERMIRAGKCMVRAVQIRVLRPLEAA